MEGIQWIIGGVLNTDSSSFFLALVPNRKWETILDVFVKYVNLGTIIATDGYPSYPRAVSQFGSIHEHVNHSEGFITNDGIHTNRIENLWSHLKQEYRSRNGLNKDRIALFIVEFWWLKKNIKHRDLNLSKIGFIKMLELFICER